MAKLSNSTREHLHFLLVEVIEQLSMAERYFRMPSQVMAERLIGRAGYADNLRTRTRNALLKQLQSVRSSHSQFRLQAIETLVSSLYQITELGRQAVGDSLAVPHTLFDHLPTKECSKLIKRIKMALQHVDASILNADSKLALEMDKERKKLSIKLTKLLNKAAIALAEKHHLKHTAEVMFPIFAIRQIIQLLGRIVEDLLSANLGQKMNVARFHSMGDIADNIDAEPDSLSISTVAETRSGSAIAGVFQKTERGHNYLAIFKEGDKKKVLEEKQSVQSWHEIYPGLAPKIISFNKRGQSASMLIEHLPGLTFERLLMEQHDATSPALTTLIATLRNIWNETKVEEPIQADYMAQLQKRLPNVYQVHPNFNNQSVILCGEQQQSFSELTEQARELEKQWPAPFSVYIHGDFNLDNIIFDPLEKRVNFIDLHRSRNMDYVQDVSVFMVSIYRLHILEALHRQALMTVAKTFLKHIRRYAKQQGDIHFEVRLTLGLIRSFATSTRFIMDPTLSRRMFLRARYLLESLLSLPSEKVNKYRVPLEDLFIE